MKADGAVRAPAYTLASQLSRAALAMGETTATGTHPPSVALLVWLTPHHRAAEFVESWLRHDEPSMLTKAERLLAQDMFRKRLRLGSVNEDYPARVAALKLIVGETRVAVMRERHAVHLAERLREMGLPMSPLETVGPENWREVNERIHRTAAQRLSCEFAFLAPRGLTEAQINALLTLPLESSLRVVVLETQDVLECLKAAGAPKVVRVESNLYGGSGNRVWSVGCTPPGAMCDLVLEMQRVAHHAPQPLLADIKRPAAQHWAACREHNSCVSRLLRFLDEGVVHKPLWLHTSETRLVSWYVARAARCCRRSSWCDLAVVREQAHQAPQAHAGW